MFFQGSGSLKNRRRKSRSVTMLSIQSTSVVYPRTARHSDARKSRANLRPALPAKTLLHDDQIAIVREFLLGS